MQPGTHTCNVSTAKFQAIVEGYKSHMALKGHHPVKPGDILIIEELNHDKPEDELMTVPVIVTYVETNAMTDITEDMTFISFAPTFDLEQES